MGEKEDDLNYVYAETELKQGPKKQIVVYLQGNDWCGTGGCTTLILEPTKDSFKLLGKIPISRIPIRRLSTTTRGWHDITVWVAGGGIDRPYEAKLRFNGKSYAHNPSLQPAASRNELRNSHVIIPREAKLEPLFSKD